MTKKDNMQTKLEMNGMRECVEIKRWRMEEGDRGLIDMTRRVRRGDTRCGSSILRVSSAWRGCCSM